MHTSRRFAWGLALSLLVLPAADAQQTGLVYPVDVIADTDGWVVADFKAHGLLRLTADGSIDPVALGEGLPRTALYGTRAVVAAPDGDGYLVADPGTFALYRVGADGAVSTITTELDIPQGLAPFDDESVLVADLRSGFGALLRVTMDGQVTVFADVDSPKGIIAVDEGFVVVSHGARALFRVDRSGRVSSIASGPPLDFPHDVAADGTGGYLVTDGYAAAVFRISASGEISVLAQGDPLVNPQGIARTTDGSYVVVDPQAGAVFEISLAGDIRRLAGVS